MPCLPGSEPGLKTRLNLLFCLGSWLLRVTQETQHLRQLITEDETPPGEDEHSVHVSDFVRIPMENRSQYEKLSSTQEELSSDDEGFILFGVYWALIFGLGKSSRKRVGRHHHHQNQRKPSNLLPTAKVRAVLGKRAKLLRPKFKPEKPNEDGAQSDDSIGSASDLRDEQEVV